MSIHCPAGDFQLFVMFRLEPDETCHPSPTHVIRNLHIVEHRSMVGLSIVVESLPYRIGVRPMVLSRLPIGGETLGESLLLDMHLLRTSRSDV